MAEVEEAVVGSCPSCLAVEVVRRCNEQMQSESLSYVNAQIGGNPLEVVAYPLHVLRCRQADV